MRLTVLSAASPPDSPTSPSPALNVAIGVAVGTLLGGLTVLARTDQKSGDDRRRGSGDPIAVAGAGPHRAGSTTGTTRVPEHWNERFEPGGPTRNERFEPGEPTRPELANHKQVGP
jgi:hypothetical protein